MTKNEELQALRAENERLRRQIAEGVRAIDALEPFNPKLAALLRAPLTHVPSDEEITKAVESR